MVAMGGSGHSCCKVYIKITEISSAEVQGNMEDWWAVMALWCEV